MRLRRIMDVLADGFNQHSSLFYKEDKQEWYRLGEARIGGETAVRDVALGLLREFWPEEAIAVEPTPKRVFDWQTAAPARAVAQASGKTPAYIKPDES